MRRIIKGLTFKVDSLSLKRLQYVNDNNYDYTYQKRESLLFRLQTQTLSTTNRDGTEAKEHPSTETRKDIFYITSGSLGSNTPMHPTQGQLSPSTLRPWFGGRTPVGRHPGHIFEFLAAPPPPPITTLLPSLFSAMDSDHLDTMADSRKLIKKIMTKDVGNALLWTSFF